MSIFAMSLPLLKAPKGWKRARYIYIKGVTERFGFDVVESRKFKRLVKHKATGTSHVVIICNPHWLLPLGNGYLGVFYIFIGVGLSALLVSTDRGNARALTRGTSIRTGSTSFLYIYGNVTNQRIRTTEPWCDTT